MRSLSLRHLRSVLVAEQVEEPVNERSAPFVADDLRAEHDVSEGPRNAIGQLVSSVEREREDVRRLVDPEVLVLQRSHLVGVDERDPELAVVDAFRREDRPGELFRSELVDRDAAAVRRLDEDHRRRAVPVSSA